MSDSRFNLWHFQKQAVNSTMSQLRSRKGNPLIVQPTGTGKSVVLSELVRRMVKVQNKKVLVLSHVKEILEQNAKAIRKHTGITPAVFSAGLKSKSIGRVTVAGIQSAHRAIELFKSFDIVLIDEAHLVSMEEGTRYQEFLSGIGNKQCIGLTATNYRLGMGYIQGDSPEKLFDYVSSNWGSKDKFNQLIEEGYLCKLVTKKTDMDMDVSDVKITAGEFNEKQLSDKFDRLSVTTKAVMEIMAAGKDRKSWMIFAIDIAHAEHIAEFLIRNGLPTAIVHSKMGDYGFSREKVIADYRIGKYRCVVNVNMLTTGYDNPKIDLIACLRPTKSPALHVQSLGRGTRVSDGKNDCLVLDFAGNTERNGPINDVRVVTKGKGIGGDPITKACPKCNSIVAPAVRVCPDCGHKFEFLHGISSSSSNEKIIDDGKPSWLNVTRTEYSLNKNFGAPTSMVVTYHTEHRKVSEWVCIEHKGTAKAMANHWVSFRQGNPTNSAEELLEQSDDLLKPYKILIVKKGKYYTVRECLFKELEN